MPYPPALSAYPHLRGPVHWARVVAYFELGADPPDRLISNVSIVPFVGAGCLVLGLADGEWELPGGTREAGEPYLATARRELLEEAGARLLAFTPFGAWRCHSSAPAAYRPHLPHPEFYRLTGYGEVTIVGPPQIPAAGGELVVTVDCVPVAEASRRFRAGGRPDKAELYELAAAIRAAVSRKGGIR